MQPVSLLECPAEMAAAVVTDVGSDTLDRPTGGQEQLRGPAKPYLLDEVHRCSAEHLCEVLAEGGSAHARLARHEIERTGPARIREHLP